LLKGQGFELLVEATQKGASVSETNSAAWPRIVKSHMLHMPERKEKQHVDLVRTRTPKFNQNISLACQS
jgi:hypothetical protein